MDAKGKKRSLSGPDSDLVQTKKKLSNKDWFTQDFDFDHYKHTPAGAIPLVYEKLNSYSRQELEFFADQFQIHREANCHLTVLTDLIGERIKSLYPDGPSPVNFESKSPSLYITRSIRSFEPLLYHNIFIYNNESIPVSLVTYGANVLDIVYCYPSLVVKYQFRVGGKLHARSLYLDSFIYREQWGKNIIEKPIWLTEDKYYKYLLRNGTEISQLDFLIEIYKLTSQVTSATALISALVEIIVDYIYPIRFDGRYIDWPDLKPQDQLE